MPVWDEALVSTAMQRVRLVADPRRRRQGEGLRLGSGPGASLEFYDHRPYAPGDDLRHLDWGASARSGLLMLRRHRREVSPRLEVLLDTSLSMAVVAEKAGLALALTALFARLSERDGGRPHVWSLGETAVPLRPAWADRLRAAAWAGRAGLSVVPGPALASGAERIVVTDGLCPEGPEAMVRRLGAEAGSLAVVQVLARRELDPTVAGAVRLVDVEGGDVDLVADAATIASYRDRLGRLQAAWQRALRGRGVGLLTVVAEDGLGAAVLRLTRGGLLAPVAA